MKHAGFTIRPITADDVNEVIALYDAGGVGKQLETERQEVETMIDFGAPYFLVMTEGDTSDAPIVASIMGTYDGHRGRIKRAVVDPQRRSLGLGDQLVTELERRFAADGITELRLEVWAQNTRGLAFWQGQRWELLEDIRYFQKSISISSRG